MGGRQSGGVNFGICICIHILYVYVYVYMYIIFVDIYKQSLESVNPIMNQ